jgi:hypothetical protein
MSLFVIAIYYLCFLPVKLTMQVQLVVQSSLMAL